MGKLQLQLTEATNYRPQKTANEETHRKVIGKLTQHNTEVIKMVGDYSSIVTSHTIPELGQPTTTTHLRQKLIQDLEVNFCCCNVIAV